MSPNRGSLAAWIVSNIVVNFVVFHGAAIMMLVGAMMSGSCILYDGLQPASPFTIPFEDAYIKFTYGWCFWTTAVSGRSEKLIQLHTINIEFKANGARKPKCCHGHVMWIADGGTNVATCQT